MYRYNVIWQSQGFTCVNVCSLNCLDLFLKYKIGQTCLVCICVFLGSMCLKLLLRDDFERLIWCLDHWLSCMLDCIHECVFHFSKNCFYTLARHLLDTLLFVELLKRFHIAISIASRYLMDRLRKLLPSRQLLNSWWIDQASVLESDGLFLNTSSILVSVEDHFLDTFPDSCLDTSRHLHLSRFTEGLFKLPRAI